MRSRSIGPILLTALILGGCRQPVSSRHEPNHGYEPAVHRASTPEAISLLGSELFAPVFSEETRSKQELDLLRAQADYDADPHDEEAVIWLGRRLAYLGRYHDAINVFNNGLAIHPKSHRLLRHRGHRYLTIRKLDLAIADLQRAAELIQGVPDEVEPDGAPNRLNIPTSTSHTNIYYHLGLAKYLVGDFRGAVESYERCLEFSKNDDMRVATLYWLYLSQQRAGEVDAAKRTLEQVSPAMTVIENHSYLLLLRVFRGEIAPASLEAPQESDSDITVDRATIGYGLAVNELIHGDRAAATVRFKKVVEDPELNWAAFGFIAAEVELARKRVGR